MPHNNKRILFVDDESNFLEGLKRGLHRNYRNWEMVFLQDPFNALAEARTTRFDAIVTDVQMPGMNGFDLLEALHQDQRTRDIPVIVLTGTDDRDLKRKALDLGATDLLTKPIHLEDLSARLNSVLRLKAYQDELKALNADLEQRVERRTRDLKWARLDIIWRLAKAGEFRDEETGEHIVRVGCYCRIIAEQIGMSRDFVEAIFLTSPLHDIGKIGISDSILLKPGRLTPQEREVMQCHCKIGANILLEEAKGMKPFLDWQNIQVPSGHTSFENGFMAMASSIAMHHHERWDGTGYPDALAGEDIPLEARIVGIVDVYDALQSDRPYKQAYSHAEAMKIMRSEASASCFDPVVYEAFEATQDEFQRIRAEIEEEMTVRRQEIQSELVAAR